jgi:hypothetical protein
MSQVYMYSLEAYAFTHNVIRNHLQGEYCHSLVAWVPLCLIINILSMKVS